MSVWTAERIAFLRENYALQGKQWCVDQLGLQEHQVRYKASQLGLRCRGTSAAWQKKLADHSKRLTGRKRPEQAAVINALRETGVLVTTEDGKRRIAEAARKRFAEGGHPRGALGHKHTAEASAVMSAKGRARAAAMQPDERRRLTERQVQGKRDKGIPIASPRGSWKAAWRDVGAQRCYFRSRWEANYARHLEALREAGHVIAWEHEPRAFAFAGLESGPVSYLPDFRVVLASGQTEWHEVKGWMDDRSRQAIALMAQQYPAERLVVIDGKQYRQIEAASKHLPGWEFAA